LNSPQNSPQPVGGALVPHTSNPLAVYAQPPQPNGDLDDSLHLRDLIRMETQVVDLGVHNPRIDLPDYTNLDGDAAIPSLHHASD
jgi:hypothetical protein